MATKNRRAVVDSSELKFLLKPFWRGMVYIITMFTLMVLSLSILCIFSDTNSLKAIIVQQKASLSTIGFLVPISTKIYLFFDWVFFDLTQIKSALSKAVNSQDPGQFYQIFVIKNYELWTKLSYALQVTALRVTSLLIYASTIGVVLYLVGVSDGYCGRSIRRERLGRESASLYHRLKYLNFSMIMLGLEVYMSATIYIGQQFVILFMVFSAIIVSTQFKFYKKYY